MEYEEVVEGSTKLKVPSGKIRSKRDPVFYNPEMELSRDLSVAVARVVSPDFFCDALAGSGVRGIRVAGEAGVSVVLNDLNPVACELAKVNARLNGVSVEVSNDEANRFLSGKKFDFVDVDPFGPPVRFLDSAVRALPKKGFLGVAATDTSALCGTYPRACRRKYDAVSLRTDYYNELGLRILLGFIARVAVRYDFGASFLFSHSTRHYMRVFARLERGRAHVKAAQDGIVFIQHCFKCLNRQYRKLDELREECYCGQKLNTAGPLWSGEFADKGFCKEIGGELLDGAFNKKKEALKLVEAVGAEQDETTPYFDLHKLCRVKKTSAPGIEELSGKLGMESFSFIRTHFCDTGFRSNASSQGLLKLI